jgi:hypothetical protein
MLQDPLTIVLRDYGWVGVVLWLIVRDVWPFLKDHIYPDAIAERKRKQEKETVLQERSTKAQELMAEAVKGIELALVATNERLSHIQTSAEAHHKATSEAITTMRERTRPLDVKRPRGQSAK